MKLEILKRVLILCEDGKSSLKYLKSFKSDEELKRNLSAVSVEVYHPKDYSPLGLVDEAKRKLEAKREKNKYDEIWIVLDKDQHANLPQALCKAKDNDIKVALSIICFEFWILLHFEKTRKEFHNCTEIIEYIKDHYYPDYQKNKSSFDDLKSKISFAIENAEWLEGQAQLDLDCGKKIHELSPFTNIHKLIKMLYFPDKYLFN